jgi:hypothetical protein
VYGAVSIKLSRDIKVNDKPQNKTLQRTSTRRHCSIFAHSSGIPVIFHHSLSAPRVAKSLGHRFAHLFSNFLTD